MNRAHLRVTAITITGILALGMFLARARLGLLRLEIANLTHEKSQLLILKQSTRNLDEKTAELREMMVAKREQKMPERKSESVLRRGMQFRFKHDYAVLKQRLLNDEEYATFRKAQDDLTSQRRYSELLRALKLDPARREAMQALLSARISAENAKNGAAIVTVDNQIRAILGEDEFKDFQIFNDQAPQRQDVDEGLGIDLKMANMPLTGAQRNALIKTLSTLGDSRMSAVQLPYLEPSQQEVVLRYLEDKDAAKTIKEHLLGK